LSENREYARQIRDFSGLVIGTITPTDLDGLIEYKNRAFIFIETKHVGAEMPFGQKLALERLCDATTKSGKQSVLFVTNHDCDGDIDFANTRVVKFYYRSKWYLEKNEPVLSEMINRFINTLPEE